MQTVPDAWFRGRPDALMRLRVRYFTDGVVPGSRELVEGIFDA